MKSAYIHIPFCNTICSYCDFCKLYKYKKWIKPYLDALQKEIEVKYQSEILDTLYIGGGTPSCLDLEDLTYLFKILQVLNKSKEIEFTFECNIEDINLEKIKLLKENNVNRISVGIQSFNDRNIKLLNRHHTKEDALKKIKLLKQYFNNINIDLIYAIPNQTLKDLENDLDCFLSLDIEHISTYSLIIEENTKLFIDKIKSIDEDLDYRMYQLINKKLKHYHHYEISNFAKPHHESKHNLTYWNNDFYYGFGLSATGYDGVNRHTNTSNLNKYIKGDYLKIKEKVSFNEKIENAFILGFRKIDGININDFENKYKININNIEIIDRLINEKKLLKENNNLKINPKYIYVSNDILMEFIGGTYEEVRNF